MILYNAAVVVVTVLCLNHFYIHHVTAGSISRKSNIEKSSTATSAGIAVSVGATAIGGAHAGTLPESSSSKINLDKKLTSDALKPETKDTPPPTPVESDKSPASNTFGFGNYESGELDDETYDDDDDDEIESPHYRDKAAGDVIDYKSSEYEERHLGPMLDTFGTKLDDHDTGSSLPVFLDEPQSTFVVRNRPAILKCKAAHALQLSFKCSGSSQPPPSEYESHVDPHTGVHLEEVTATISRDLVDEYFGKGPFKCECHAWSSRGGAKSQVAIVEVAYIRKQFAVSPSSARVEFGGRIELHCEAPNALPTAKIAWYKNNVPIVPEHPVVITAEGSLHITQVTLQDMANYTCIAENIAGKRISDPVTITVFVDGGWSAWSPWMECKCPGKLSQGKKRTRNCSNPLPLNGGAQCEGPNVQKTPDCTVCPAGRWSPWSEWSSCSVDCIQIRRRKCITHTVDDSLMGGSVSFSEGYDKSLCPGKDFQTAECRGGSCRIGRDDSDWPLYLGLTVITAVCIALGAALIRTARKGRHIPPYNMARTVMQTEYLHDADKKAIHFHNDITNGGTANYEYPTAAHRPLTGSITMSRSISEHHYDVPNLASTYTTPIDGLSAKYSYDTADTSTSTSDSTYDVASEPPTLPMPPKGMCKLSTTREVMTSIGGFLKLYNGATIMYVPDMAVGKNLKHTISLSILSDECSRIITSDSSTYLSPVVYCGPVDLTFHKPIILKIPHCMVEPRSWNISIFHSDCFIQESNVKWKQVATVGEETINTPVFVQVDDEFAYIMTEHLGRYVLLGEPYQKDSNATKKMKLIVFGQIAPASDTCSLRVYVVDDFPNCRDMCARVESQLGGSFMGESATFVFHLNTCDFNIQLNCIGEWQPANKSDAQIIPYHHMLNSNSILHCEFSLQRTEQPCIGLKLEINYSQSEDIVDSYMFVIPHATLETSNPSSIIKAGGVHEKKKSPPATIVVDKDGSYVSDIQSELRLPRNTKKLICATLDPPRSDGNDWRLLANLLHVDRYIAYFATKPSPTEQILNLWECRNRNSKAILELVAVLKEMDRYDVVELVEKSVGPLWF